MQLPILITAILSLCAQDRNATFTDEKLCGAYLAMT